MVNSATFNDIQKQKVIKEQYDKIYAHELAHKMAGGSLAGSIVIENNAQGIPVAGHVDIKMPALNNKNPKQTISDAKTVINSAMAPSDPSQQDYKVANEARILLNKAQEIEKENGLNYLA